MIDFSWDNSLITRDQAANHYELTESVNTDSAPLSSLLSAGVVHDLLTEVNVKVLGSGVFSVPWLSPKLCRDLSRTFPASKYTPNQDEEYAAQIPEIVLYDHAIDLACVLETYYDSTLRPLVHLLTGQDIAEFGSIQLARYEPSEVSKGCFHTDQDSDITVTVALNDNYEGGGLEVYESFGIVSSPLLTIPKLPVGTATIFRGKTMLHRGLEVTSGVKHLLVFWMKT